MLFGKITDHLNALQAKSKIRKPWVMHLLIYKMSLKWDS